MNIDSDKHNKTIIKAFNVLNKQIDLSNKSDFEKKALMLLVKKIETYYLKRLELIREDETSKLFALQVYMTDVIADINYSLSPNARTFDYIEKINEKLHDSEIGHMVSRNKYLSYKLR